MLDSRTLVWKPEGRNRVVIPSPSVTVRWWQESLVQVSVEPLPKWQYILKGPQGGERFLLVLFPVCVPVGEEEGGFARLCSLQITRHEIEQRHRTETLTEHEPLMLLDAS
jgi:hypothetical protein